MKSQVWKRIRCLFLALCFTVVFLVPISAVSPVVDNRSANESQSITQYQLLMTEFKHQKLRNETPSDYPDYYAGAYIQEDGKLVVLLTEVSKTHSDSICSLIRSSDVVFKTASVPYNDLVSQRDDIIQTYERLKNNSLENTIDDDLSTLLNSFIGIGIEERNNRIEVSLTDTSAENIDAFREYLSSYEHISFEQSGAAEKHTSLSPGTYIRAGENAGSIGYRSYRQLGSSTFYGFTTAAHVAGSYGQSIYNAPYYPSIPSVVCGTVITSLYSGTIDAAFVQTASGFTVTNQTPAGKILASSWFTSIPEGMSVIMHGKTSGEKSGVVRNNAYYFTTSDGVSLTDVLRCSYDADFGDSGGVVFSLYNGDYTIVGIHHGVVSILQGLNGRAIASKAHNIYTLLNVAPY